uniref:Uncharacterized protein n=1 Tax=Setaria italica TaxID=4555 RepID=K3ZXV0_SETIT
MSPSRSRAGWTSLCRPCWARSACTAAMTPLRHHHVLLLSPLPRRRCRRTAAASRRTAPFTATTRISTSSETWLMMSEKARAVHGVHACVGMGRLRARWRCCGREQDGDVSRDSSKAASKHVSDVYVMEISICLCSAVGVHVLYK